MEGWAHWCPLVAETIRSKKSSYTDVLMIQPYSLANVKIKYPVVEETTLAVSQKVKHIIAIRP